MNKLNQKKFRIWSDTLNEENLCETIGGFDFEENKQKNERGIESYRYESENYTRDEKNRIKRIGSKQKKKSPQIKNHLITKIPQLTQELKSDIISSNLSIKERLGPKITYDESKSRSHIHVTELDTDEAVAKEIVRILQEPKDDVIKRCVNVLGKKKCLELLFATEDVENTGGMLTSDGYRRRSPGGVFFQLLRKDDTILNCQRSKIFIEETLKKKKAKRIKRLRQKEKFDKAKKDLEEKVQNNNKELDDINNEDNEKSSQNDEDDIEKMEENDMIYFDE